MKNITLSVEDQVYRRARAVAAMRDTSVSALVRRFLEQLAEEDADAWKPVRKRLDQAYAAIDRKKSPQKPVGRLTRGALHDRRVR